MGRGAAISFAAAAAALSVASCSLLLGEGFTDPDTPASADGGEAGDGAAGDAVVPPDGGGDAAAAADASLCALDAAGFCDDFERDGVDVQGGWSTVTLTDGGILSTVASGSGSRLHATIGPAGSRAYLTRAVTLVPKRVHFELTLEYPALPATGAALIAGLAMFPPGSASGPTLLYVYADPEGVNFVQQVAGQASYRRDALLVGPKAAHRIVVDVVLGGAARVSVDGDVRVDRAAEAFLFAAPPQVSLGTDSLDDTGESFEMFADDFVFFAE